MKKIRKYFYELMRRISNGRTSIFKPPLLGNFIPPFTEGLARKVNALENKYDKHFKVVFDAVRQLMNPPEPPRKQIGFKPE